MIDFSELYIRTEATSFPQLTRGRNPMRLRIAAISTSSQYRSFTVSCPPKASYALRFTMRYCPLANAVFFILLLLLSAITYIADAVAAHRGTTELSQIV